MSVGGICSNSEGLFNEVTACQPMGARAATQHTTRKNLENALIFHYQKAIETARGNSENHDRRNGESRSVTEVQIAHEGLIRINRYRFSGAARSTSSHHPDQVEDRESLNDTEDHRDKYKGQKM